MLHFKQGRQAQWCFGNLYLRRLSFIFFVNFDAFLYSERIGMDKVNYETYDTDAVYDDMDQNTSAEKVNSMLLCQVIVFFSSMEMQVNAVERAPQQKREEKDKGRSGNKRVR